MRRQWRRWSGILAVIMIILPIVALAQDFPRGSRGGNSRDWPRGPIHITNDWQDDVRLTLWSHRRERIGEWTLQPGGSAFLDAEGTPIKVRPSYKIKVGEDWGWADLGEVGQFQQGTWYVRVRDIWRATHRDRPGVPD